MLIENQDAFRTWLTSILEPLCDADPAALAKYVCALVKKDKPLDDLRDGMVDQLDVFLQHETKPFVELLFKTLETQEYLQVVIPDQTPDIPANPPQPSTEAVQSEDVPPTVHQNSYQNRRPSANSDLSPARDHIVNGGGVVSGSLLATVDANGSRIVTNEATVNTSATSKREREHREESGARASATSKPRIVLNRSSKFVPATVPKEKPAYATEQTLVKVMPDLLEDSLNEPLVSTRNSRKDRKSDSDKEDRRNRGRQVHRSRSPGGAARSRSRSWERARRGPQQISNSAQGGGGGGNQSQGSRGAPWRNRSPPIQRYDRRRSRSGSPPPVRAPRYRNRSPPPGTAITDVPPNRSRSRSGERFPSPYHNNLVVSRNRIRVSRERERERDRLPRDQITRTVNNSDRDRDAERDRLDRDRDRSDRDRDRPDRDNRDNARGRPRDDTPTQDSNPGDCTNQPRGGATTLAGIFGPAAKKRCRDFDEKGYCMRGDLCQFDHGSDPVVLHAAADAALSRVLSMPIGGMPPRPPVPGCISEYNPLAPDIWSRGVNRFNAPPPPPPQMPPLPLSMPPLPNMTNMPGMAGPHMHPQHHLQRELIPIQTVRPEDMRPLDPSQPVPGMMPPNMKGGPPPPHHRMPPHPHNYNTLPPNMIMQGKKKQFDFNRLGPNRHHMSKAAATGNSSLELKKVPRGLNDITHLNNHFSKFGKIVNIQVSYEGDPEAAIITFSSHTEANIAYKSTEAVLNNRFIKVLWHNAESKQENVPPGQVRGPVKDRLTPNNLPANSNNSPGVPGTTNHISYHKVLINKDNLKITNTALAEAKQQAAAVAAATLALNNNNNNGDTKSGDEAATPTKPPTATVNPLPGAPTIAPPGSVNVTLLRTVALNNVKENVANSAASVELAALVKRRGEGAAKIARDLRRRKQQLLDKQLQQQKSLIAKLETTTVTDAQREVLFATIKSIQESIEKTRKELISKTSQLPQAEEMYVSSTLSKMYIDPKGQQYDSLTVTPSIVGHLRKTPRTKEEAQREILDAELDLFTKQQEGQDVGDLQRRIADLRRQQVTMRAAPIARRPTQIRAALRAKYSKLAAMGALKSSQFITHSVDHRPKSLLISGYEADEQDQVLVHLAQFGEIVDKVVDTSTPSVWVQYGARKEAELALSKGKQFSDRILSVTWSQQPMPLRQTITPAVQALETPVAVISEPVSSASIESLTDAGDVTNDNGKLLREQSAENINKKVTTDDVTQPSANQDIAKVVQQTLNMEDQEFEGGLDISEDILLNDDEEDDEENEDRSWRR